MRIYHIFFKESVEVLCYNGKKYAAKEPMNYDEFRKWFDSHNFKMRAARDGEWIVQDR